MKPLQELVRPNVWKLAAAKEADGEPSGQDIHVFLDANENPYNRPLNRYPDPLQHELKAELSRIKNVSEEHIFIGNGTIEAIDLAYRVFCRPQNDNVVAIEPTRDAYKACADMNDVEYRPVQLGEHFQLSSDRLLAACDRHTKIIWLCSP
ncbi:MAG: aminotransferase class I/II-fold pyridoxal phosphate-dependent enzyme, partial [Prevotella sp.]